MAEVIPRYCCSADLVCAANCDSIGFKIVGYTPLVTIVTSAVHFIHVSGGRIGTLKVRSEFQFRHLCVSGVDRIVHVDDIGYPHHRTCSKFFFFFLCE